MSSDEAVELAGGNPLLCPDGLDDAIVGVAFRDNVWVAVYSVDKVYEELVKHMTPDEAEEHFAYNIEGGWVGPRTPIWMRP